MGPLSAWQFASHGARSDPLVQSLGCSTTIPPAAGRDGLGGSGPPVRGRDQLPEASSPRVLWPRPSFPLRAVPPTGSLSTLSEHCHGLNAHVPQIHRWKCNPQCDRRGGLRQEGEPQEGPRRSRGQSLPPWRTWREAGREEGSPQPSLLVGLQPPGLRAKRLARVSAQPVVRGDSSSLSEDPPQHPVPLTPRGPVGGGGVSVLSLCVGQPVCLGVSAPSPP